MQILTVAIQKGGTGKTVTAAILAQAATYKKKKALAIDLDPQGNLTLMTGGDANKTGSSYDFILGASSKDVIQTTPQGFDLIPASPNLSALTTDMGSATRLKKALERLHKKYNLIIIDTPALLGELQYMALYAATGLIIPLQADIFSLQSLYQINDAARQMQKRNDKLSIKGFFISMLDTRIVLSKEMQEKIMQAAKDNNIPYLGSVRRGIVVAEAAALQESLYSYAPKSKPAQDYLKLLNKII